MLKQLHAAKLPELHVPMCESLNWNLWVFTIAPPQTMALWWPARVLFVTKIVLLPVRCMERRITNKDVSVCVVLTMTWHFYVLSLWQPITMKGCWKSNHWYQNRVKSSQADTMQWERAKICKQSVLCVMSSLLFQAKLICDHHSQSSNPL